MPFNDDVCMEPTSGTATVFLMERNAVQKPDGNISKERILEHDIMAESVKGKRDKVVLAYSGGLDTSVAIHWLQEQYDVDVIAIAINVGQPPSKDDIVARALRNGAIKADFIDATEEFVSDYVWPSLKANALYQNVYPLSTSIARPLIAKKLVEVANAEGAKYIAHGCTAKGNDQVRFDVGIVSQNPNLKIIAPMREWVTTREKEIEYAKEHGI